MQGELLALAHSLAALLYVGGVLVQTLPIPWASIKLQGPQLMKQGIISEVAILSVSLVTILVGWISEMFTTAAQMPIGSDAAFALIISQLGAIEVAILLLIGIISSSVVLAPLAYAISSMTSSILNFVTVALVLWLVIKAVSVIITSSWLYFYIFGVVAYAIPWVGRSIGPIFWAGSIIAVIAIPIMPALAISLQGSIGYDIGVGPLENTISSVRFVEDPLFAAELLARIPQMIAGLMVAVVISLILFPFAYLFLVSVATKSLAGLLGSSSRTSVSSFVLAPAWNVGGKIS